MKNPLEIVSELESLIRDLHKLDSKMLAGQFINAHRDLRRIMANVEEKKNAVIAESKKQEGDNEKQPA